MNRASWRTTAALLLLTLPFFACPLIWLRPWCGPQPYWGEAVWFGPGEIGLLAAAIAVAFPEHLIQLWRENHLARCWLGTTGLLLLLTLVRQIATGGSTDLVTHSLFFLATPLAGAALFPEISRLLPHVGAAAFVVLLFFTGVTPDFTGLPGNWNWNLSLLALTLPSVFLLLPCSLRRRFILAFSSVVIGLLAFSVLRPELAPRGTIAGVIGATLLVGLLWQLPRRRRKLGAIIMGGLGIFLLLSLALSNEISGDSRIELWRGALDAVMTHPIIGVGAGRFVSAIAGHLPEEYFFSPYAATLHSHPHNELLNSLAAFGILGGVWLALLYIGAVSSFRRRRPLQMYLTWMFAALLIHGQFDVLLATPLAGTWFLAIGGVLFHGWEVNVAQAVAMAEPRGRGSKFIGAALAIVLTALAGVESCREGISGLRLRSARLLRQSGSVDAAAEKLAQSRALKPTPEALYFESRLELFDRKNPAAALRRLAELDALGFPDYCHSNGLRGRALVLTGDIAAALKSFERELVVFPFSAFYAGLRFDTLRKQPGTLPETVNAAREYYENRMKLRGLKPTDFIKLIQDPELDDRPLTPMKNEAQQP